MAGMKFTSVAEMNTHLTHFNKQKGKVFAAIPATKNQLVPYKSPHGLLWILELLQRQIRCSNLEHSSPMNCRALCGRYGYLSHAFNQMAERGVELHIPDAF